MPTAAIADPDILARLHGRSLLATDDYADEELKALLAVAERFAALDRAGKKAPLLTQELA